MLFLYMLFSIYVIFIYVIFRRNFICPGTHFREFSFMRRLSIAQDAIARSIIT